jgi:hypothetical protein
MIWLRKVEEAMSLLRELVELVREIKTELKDKRHGDKRHGTPDL